VWVWGGVWVVDPRKVVGFRLPCLLALLFLLLSPSALHFSAFYIARAPPFPPLVPVDNYAGFSCFSKGRLLVILSLKFEFWN
jgi:hypothetical protein